MALRVSDEEVRRYRALGAWRATSAVDDVARWAGESPDAPALLADRADGGLTVVTWDALAGHVRRFAAALAELGVDRGDVLAVQLPNWWEAAALTVACWSRGAVLAPVMTTIRERELSRMLAGTGARVAVTTGVWNGYDHAAALARVAAGLAAPPRRVVLGGPARDGEIGLADRLQDPGGTSGEEPVSAPDELAEILFTSGTTGEPRAALRSQNNHYAQMGPSMRDAQGRPVRRVYTPQSLMHSAGLGFLIHALAVGGTLLLTDTWRPAVAARLLAEHRIEQITLVPPFLVELLGAVHAEGIRLPALREVYAVGSTVGADLAERTAEVLGLPLRSVWAMTEGGRANTDDRDPPGWAARSIGRPPSGTELELRPTDSGGRIDEHRPGRLLMRGASVCLATRSRAGGPPRVTAEHDDGWYDTGDLAVPDGRDGFRLVGRAADRVGGAFMIPVSDVEEVLRGHPRVLDVAVVGHRGGIEGCAVLVTTGPVDLADVHDHLRAAGMTDWYWPTRVELVDTLPRNAMGKVEKVRLRSWLADLPAGRRS
jgi:cyclohexanecarboxylate-CoA ligase